MEVEGLGRVIFLHVHGVHALSGGGFKWFQTCFRYTDGLEDRMCFWKRPMPNDPTFRTGKPYILTVSVRMCRTPFGMHLFMV